MRDNALATYRPLKLKERDVVIRQLHAEGYTNGQIARVVRIDKNSVSRRLSKMGLKANLPQIAGADEYKAQTICWSCQNACGGCPWTEVDPDTDQIRALPVEGWIAKKHLQQYADKDGRRMVESYEVLYCPQYSPDPPRKAAPLLLVIQKAMEGSPCIGCPMEMLCQRSHFACKDKSAWEVAHG